jgi:hypothetical protein
MVIASPDLRGFLGRKKQVAFSKIDALFYARGKSNSLTTSTAMFVSREKRTR